LVAAPRLLPDEDMLHQHLARARTSTQCTNLLDDPLGALAGRDLPPPGQVHQLTLQSWPVRHRAKLSLSGSGAAVVGLGTQFQVGWTAEQAGRSLPVLRASGTHVAALVEDVSAGPVEFEYRPPNLTAGIVSSVAGFTALALVLGLPRRTRSL
jgi:hypothetical protein